MRNAKWVRRELIDEAALCVTLEQIEHEGFEIFSVERMGSYYTVLARLDLRQHGEENADRATSIESVLGEETRGATSSRASKGSNRKR